MAEGQWALVTGATGGIGSAISQELARRGWNVVAAARDVEKLKDLAARLEAQGAVVRCVTCDLADAQGAQRLVERVDALGVGIELLVNNAGFGYTAPFAESELARQRALVQVDVMSVMELAHAYSARMAAAGRGYILNVASVAGFMPGAGMSTYFASKAFVQSLSQGMHEELRHRGVQVMALCPGPVGTAFWDTADSAVAAFEHLMITPEQVARIAYTALMRGRTVCAPGLVSKVCYGFGRLAPYVVSRPVVGALMGHNKKR